jgi:endonuclease/exonuclease/phosphatase family metal-dependent hydrolase
VKINRFDFYLVGVHLKSKITRPGLPSPLEMRDRQCAAIAERLHTLTEKGPEKDVMIVGDYNMTPEGQAAPDEAADAKNFDTLNRFHNLRFLSSEVKSPTHVGFFQGRFRASKLDGFAISNSAVKEYVPDSFRVLNDEALGAGPKQFTNHGKEFLSDHYPIVADFKTEEDGD